MRTVTSWAVAGLLLELGCGQVRAENPRVHLKLENVTAAEAADALGRAAHTEVSIFEAANAEPRLLEKAAFDWSDITLADALRQLVKQYQLRLSHFGGLYQLFPSAAPAQAPVSRYRVEQGRASIALQRISVSLARNINFDGAMSMDSGGMTLNFGARLQGGDADTILGVGNLSAKDDQGNVLTSDQPTFINRGVSIGPGYPDEWSGTAFLPPPSAKARKLTWIEGELLAYRTYKRVPLEIPVAETGKPKSFLGATVELTRFDTQAPRQGDPQRGGSCQVEVRATASGGAEFPFNRSPSIRLIGKSGRVYEHSGGGMSSGGGSSGYTLRMEGTFTRITEEIDRVILTRVEASDPQRVMTFRLIDVPLPEDAPVVPRKQAALRVAPGANVPVRKAEFAFEQLEGGGTLVTSVNVGVGLVPQGTLSVGLAAKEGDGWGPIRWMDADVDTGGAARLEHLKPGTYRMLRVFRTNKEALPLKPGGRWQNNEVVVTVAAGKEVTVPPLVWAIPPPATPKR